MDVSSRRIWKSEFFASVAMDQLVSMAMFLIPKVSLRFEDTADAREGMNGSLSPCVMAPSFEWAVWKTAMRCWTDPLRAGRHRRQEIDHVP